MKALIDGKLTEIKNGVQYENNIPVASHATGLSKAPYQGRENFRLITTGHVYILNYNEKTYQPKKPETFTEYLKMKSEEKKMWVE